MKPLRIDHLEWDDWNVAHIAEHGVEVEEVEWICCARRLMARRAGVTRYGLPRYQVYGQTESGRYLFIVLDREVAGCFYPVTARDMTDDERRLFKKARGR